LTHPASGRSDVFNPFKFLTHPSGFAYASAPISFIVGYFYGTSFCEKARKLSVANR